MRRKFTYFALIALQWFLIIWGLFLIAVALHRYSFETHYFASLPEALAGEASYSPPVVQRMLTSVVTGLVAMGLGAALFYLRRLFLRHST